MAEDNLRLLYILQIVFSNLTYIDDTATSS